MLVVERFAGGYTLEYTDWLIFVEEPIGGGRWRWELHRKNTDASRNISGWCDREDEVMKSSVAAIQEWS